MSTDLKDKIFPSIIGHVLIRDPESGEVFLDKKNAIHYENMSLAIGWALANRGDGIIDSMAFGNGGSAVSGTGAITYFPTRTVGQDADLYAPAGSVKIDGQQNFIEVRHLQGTPYTDVIVTVTLEYDWPSGQEVFDNASNANGDFVFDELGLKNIDGMLMTHVIFNPIQKSLNRLIEVVYTLRIQMS